MQSHPCHEGYRKTNHNSLCDACLARKTGANYPICFLWFMANFFDVLDKYGVSTNGDYWCSLRILKELDCPVVLPDKSCLPPLIIVLWHRRYHAIAALHGFLPAANNQRQS